MSTEYYDYSELGNIGYDFLVAASSLVSMVLNLVVLAEFWSDDAVFFIISLVIISLSSIVYAVGFSGSKLDNWYLSCCLCFVGPLLPLVQCIFVFDKSNRYGYNTYVWDSMIQVWKDIRLKKHFGFNMQVFISTIPQMLLQFVYVAMKKEISSIFMVSLLSALISLYLKSLMVARGYNYLSYFWYWCCIITDITGYMFILFFVFYQQDDSIPSFNFDDPIIDKTNFFNIFGQIWFFRLILLSIPTWIGSFLTFSTTQGYGCCDIMGIVLKLVFFTQFSVYLCFGWFAEKYCWIKFGSSLKNIKQVSYDNIESLIDFINESNAKSTEDRIIKIISANYAMHESHWYINQESPKIINYLNEMKAIEQLSSITLSDLRSNCNHPERTHLFKAVWNKYYQSECIANRTCKRIVLAPFFITNKMIQVLYP